MSGTKNKETILEELEELKRKLKKIWICAEGPDGKNPKKVKEMEREQFKIYGRVVYLEKRLEEF